MPIIDVEFVRGADEALPGADELAQALGRALKTPPGRTWVRLRRLAPQCYAENDEPVLA